MVNEKTKPTVSLALVVMNEEQGVEAIVPKIDRSAFDAFFAIDGNSSDRTRPLLEEYGVPVYNQEGKGLGAAMISARTRTETTHLVFFHPDGNENPADLPRMAEMLRSGKEFVVASRMISGAKNEEDDQFFRPRKIANKGFALAANILFSHGGNRTSDVTNGFRGIACKSWDRMQLTSRDLTMDYQMVIRALKLGIPITEFPTSEGARVAGGTKFESIPTGMAELGLLWREWRMGRRQIAGENA